MTNVTSDKFSSGLFVHINQYKDQLDILIFSDVCEVVTRLSRIDRGVKYQKKQSFDLGSGGGTFWPPDSVCVRSTI